MVGGKATTTCRDACTSLTGCVNGGRIGVSRIGRHFMAYCESFLSGGKTARGAVKCCLEGFETLCGLTMGSNLIPPYSCPFGRVYAGPYGAMGHTLSQRRVIGLTYLSLRSSTRLGHSLSLFLFNFCTRKVTFISVTCLG